MHVGSTERDKNAKHSTISSKYKQPFQIKTRILEGLIEKYPEEKIL